jgi:hypothetical protein
MSGYMEARTAAKEIGELLKSSLLTANLKMDSGLDETERKSIMQETISICRTIELMAPLLDPGSCMAISTEINNILQDDETLKAGIPIVAAIAKVVRALLP